MENIQSQLELYVGIGLAFTFSVVSFYIMFRHVRGREQPDWNVLVIVGAAMLAGVILVGNTPVVSLIQNVVISLGCLYAVYQHVTTRENPNPKIIALLVTAMIVSLLITQASRSFNIGLREWFQVQVDSPRDIPKAVQTSLGAIEERISKMESNLSELNRGQSDLSGNRDGDSKRLASLEARLSNLQALPSDGGAAEKVVGLLRTRVDLVEKEVSSLKGRIAGSATLPAGGSVRVEDLVSPLKTRLDLIEKELYAGASLSALPQPAHTDEIQVSVDEPNTVSWGGAKRYELCYTTRRGFLGGLSFDLAATDLSLDQKFTLYSLRVNSPSVYRWMSPEGPKAFTVTPLSLSTARAKIRFSERLLTSAEWQDYVREQEEQRRHDEEFFNRPSAGTEEKAGKEPNAAAGVKP